jgi:hypothetical protein
MSPEIESEKLLRQAKELQDVASQFNAKFDRLEQENLKTQARMRFFSRAKKNLWRMPSWLWMPIVGLLVALFLVALVMQG